jgi:serine-type D-Ala-D-Ala carboxypeptidase/endopeptidase (penicillin-binding protein 4)
VSGLWVGEAGTDAAPMIRVRGPYSAGCGEQGTFVSVLSHRQFAQGLFKALWSAAGGTLTGVARYEPGAARGEPWMQWESPRTLAEIVTDVNKFSNNVMARQLLLQVALARSGAPATLQAARQAAQTWLADRGLAMPELVLDNGSGLSRNARVSATGLARLLAHASADTVLGPLLRQSLPRVGVDGTMRNRLTQDPVAGQAWIKTGTLADVKTMAGYVQAASGHSYALVLLINAARAQDGAAVQDAVLRWLYANG